MLQEKFRKSGEFVPSYNYQDIAAGTGYSVFYACRSDVDDEGMLISNSEVSGKGYTDNDETVTFTTTEFLKPREIKGRVFITIPLGIYIPTGIGGTFTAAVTNVKLQHIDASNNVTDLSTAQSPSNLSNSDDGTTRNEGRIVVTASINQLVKKGEKLRLTLTTDVESRGYLFHNPSGQSVNPTTNSAVSFSITKLMVAIPFDLNL
jgi:hypothetical protein